MESDRRACGQEQTGLPVLLRLLLFQLGAFQPPHMLGCKLKTSIIIERRLLIDKWTTAKPFFGATIFKFKVSNSESRWPSSGSLQAGC